MSPTLALPLLTHFPPIAFQDVYIYWFDSQENICKSFKTSVPTDTVSSWTRSAFWGGAARFAYNLGDGFQPEDLTALATGYWMKQYHDEMEEDLRLIKTNMNMLGEEPAQGDKKEEL